VDTDSDLIFNEVSKLITDEAAYAAMSRKNNPYGDGQACERIVWKTANLLGYPNEFKP
jgi:UDP-N-acetylglucosamine 2-epimerase (non-hydrolysing)